MGVPKLSDDVDTTADALNLVEQYKAWLADTTEEAVPHPGHGNMADAAVKLAAVLEALRSAAERLRRATTTTSTYEERLHAERGLDYAIEISR